MSIRRAATAAALAGAALFAASGAASAAPAPHAHGSGADPAVSCSWGYSNSSAGTGNAKLVNTKIHTGPYASCPTKFTVGTGDELFYQCAVTNSYGNVWINVHYYYASGKAPYDGWVYYQDVSGSWPVASC